MKLSTPAKHAAMIGGVCAFSYLTVYIVRNILGAVSPQMISAGVLTTEDIGTMSSAYFTTYALGQLINGIVGDRLKAKYMIGLGLGFAGLCCGAIPFVAADTSVTACVFYGAMGFFLSMIYGPMTKTVAENTDPRYTSRCSFGYTMASLVGSPFAGLLGMVLAWNTSFVVGGVLLIVMGILFFLFFTVFERKGIVSYGRYRPRGRGVEGVRELLSHHIIKYIFIAAVTGVVKTTVVSWLSTYFSQYLGYSPEGAALLFTVCTAVISLTVFLAMFFYELSRRNMERIITLSFLFSALCVLGAFFLKSPLLNIACVVLGIMGSNSAAVMLWSCYCPGLRDTGMVSTVTGFLDFISYMAGSLTATLSARAVGAVGWRWLLFVWFGLMLFGTVVSLTGRRRTSSRNEI